MYCLQKEERMSKWTASWYQGKGRESLQLVGCSASGGVRVCEYVSDSVCVWKVCLCKRRVCVRSDVGCVIFVR